MANWTSQSDFGYFNLIGWLIICNMVIQALLACQAIYLRVCRVPKIFFIDLLIHLLIHFISPLISPPESMDCVARHSVWNCESCELATRRESPRIDEDRRTRPKVATVQKGRSRRTLARFVKVPRRRFSERSPFTALHVQTPDKSPVWGNIIGNRCGEDTGKTSSRVDGDGEHDGASVRTCEICAAPRNRIDNWLYCVHYSNLDARESVGLLNACVHIYAAYTYMCHRVTRYPR